MQVLIVDDDSMVRQLVRKTLGESWVFLEAADAETAFDILDVERPDLILLDWVLPGLSGPNFFKRLQRDKERSSIPVIIVSARGEEQTRKAAAELGAAGHLSKPFNVQDLRNLVVRVVPKSVPEPDATLLEERGAVALTHKEDLTANT